jgi:hypothetical protein
VAVKNNYMQMEQGSFWDFLGQFLPYLQGKLLKLVMLREYIIKHINTKQDLKNVYNPSRIEILMLGDFQNVRGFLFWIGPISIKNLKNLELERHSQCASNSHTHFLKIFLLILLDFYG